MKLLYAIVKLKGDFLDALSDERVSWSEKWRTLAQARAVHPRS